MGKIDPQAVQLVKKAEELRLEAYRCPAGVPTIGWGHTAGVVMGHVITEEQAERYLQDDLTNALVWVRKFVQVPLSSEQEGALASFVFNLGAGSLQASTLRKKLNTKDYLGAAGEFGKWVYATVNGEKVKLPGLISRRAAEKELFLKGTKDVRNDV